MHPMVITHKIDYELEWAMVDPENASAILRAVCLPEKFEATLFNPLNNEVETHTYYMSDAAAPMQQWMPDRKDGKLFNKISFKIIEV